MLSGVEGEGEEGLWVKGRDKNGVGLRTKSARKTNVKGGERGTDGGERGTEGVERGTEGGDRGTEGEERGT